MMGKGKFLKKFVNAMQQKIEYSPLERLQKFPGLRGEKGVREHGKYWRGPRFCGCGRLGECCTQLECEVHGRL